MTELDEALIKQAYKVSCYRSWEVDDLIDQAETKEAYDRLQTIRRILRAEEEKRNDHGF